MFNPSISYILFAYLHTLYIYLPADISKAMITYLRKYLVFRQNNLIHRTTSAPNNKIIPIVSIACTASNHAVKKILRLCKSSP